MNDPRLPESAPFPLIVETFALFASTFAGVRAPRRQGVVEEEG